MVHVTKWMAITLIIGLTLTSVGTLIVEAQQTGPPTTMPHPGPSSPPSWKTGTNGSVFVKTDIIAIMANGRFPMFHFWFANDENGRTARFFMAYLSIIEFEDGNGDGAFQSNETLFFAPLAAYDWTLQIGYNQQSGVTTELWLKYTKGGIRSESPLPEVPSVPIPGMGAGSVSHFKDVTLQIWAHLFLYDYAGNVSDEHGVRASYLIEGSSELKMDIEIGNFPFSTNTSMVSVQTMIHEDARNMYQHTHRHRYETRERYRNNTGTSDNNWNSEGNETRFEQMADRCIQRIDLVDTTTGVPLGFFSWVDKATVTWPGGAVDVVNVTASYVPTGMGLALYLAYPNFDGGTILHDPSIGLYENAAPTIRLNDSLITNSLIIGGILVVALLAVSLHKRRTV